jgi:hypothetical protein
MSKWDKGLDILLDVVSLLILTVLIILLSPVIGYIAGLRDFDLVLYSLTLIWATLWIILLSLFTVYKRLEGLVNE